MKRLRLGAAVLMAAAFGPAPVVAQATPHGMPEPDEGIEYKRIVFGQLCGIANVAAQSAIGLSRSSKGEWSVIAAGEHPVPGADAAARVWHENNWMVDLHDVPGTSMHAGQLCFAPGGQLILQTDDYMDVPRCACVRFTAQSLDESGKVTNYKQRFVSVVTGDEIAAPPAAKGFPAVFDFRRVEQLPFYPLVKK